MKNIRVFNSNIKDVVLVPVHSETEREKRERRVHNRQEGRAARRRYITRGVNSFITVTSTKWDSLNSSKLRRFSPDSKKETLVTQQTMPDETIHIHYQRGEATINKL